MKPVPIWRRFDRLLGTDRASDVRDELRFHIEAKTDDLIAQGWKPDAARQEAERGFGDFRAVLRVGERIGGKMDRSNRFREYRLSSATDLRYAFRGILAHRWFSAAIVATLALGIGLNTMVFTLVNAVLLKPVPVPNGDKLVSVAARNLSRDDHSQPFSYPDFQEYKAQARSFEFLEAVASEAGVFSEPGNPPEQYQLIHATTGIFSMVQAKALLGRTFLPTDELPGAAPVVVIAYKVWQERYTGLPNVIGRQVRVNGQPATIIGVMPKGFRFPDNVDLWMPLSPTASLAKRDSRTLWGYAILKPEVNLRQAGAELDGIAVRLASQFPVDKGLGMSVLTFQQRMNGGVIRTVFLLMLAAVSFVLLIACADVANMMLSRSMNRQREMSIRTALGASRWRIIRQLLIESVVLSTVGGVLGLGLAAGGIHWFDLATAAVRPQWILFTMNFTVFGYFAALCILSGLLFGILPALRSSKTNVVDVLKESAHNVAGPRGAWLSSVLVVFQFALTLVLLTGAGIFVRSLLDRLAVNPFIPSDQITMARLRLPEDRYKDNDARIRLFDHLLPRLRSIAGVTHAAIASAAPGMGSADEQIELEHVPVTNPTQRPWISFVAQSPGYFDTIHLPLLQGRDFNQADGASGHEAAVLTRDAAARFWPGQDPIGKRFRLFDDKNKPTPWITVIGISANMVQELEQSDHKPLLFIPYRQEGWDNMALVVESTGDPLQAMRKAVESLDEELPIHQPSRLKDAIAERLWFLRVFGDVFLTFALVAMLMASVGIYAVIAQATGSRTREIGVRIALGAAMHNILLLVMRRGLWQIVCGLALGLAAAVPVNHQLASITGGELRSDPFVIFEVALTLALVGVFACWLPARRAAGLDPVRAIRYE